MLIMGAMIIKDQIFVVLGVECGDLPLPASSNRSQPRVAVLSREVGGRAAFSCKLGFGIRGPSESICLPSGEWATPFPTCVGMQANLFNFINAPHVGSHTHSNLIV